MPVKLRLELDAVVGLHHVHPKRQAGHDVVHEENGRALIERVVDLQDANAGAIVDGRELIERRRVPASTPETARQAAGGGRVGL